MFLKLRDLSSVRAEVAAASDFGIPGTKRIGSPRARDIYVISALVYEGEVEALAAFAKLLRDPPTLRDNVQIALVTARPELREETNNLNRLSEGWGKHNWERDRAEEISQAFSRVPIKAMLDLQTNPQPLDESGWAVVVRSGTSMAPNVVPCSLLIEGLTDQQDEATGTQPFGTLFPCPAVEVLTWPGRKGQNASVETALSWLAAYGCFPSTKTVKERVIVQKVVRTIGYIKTPDPTLAYELNYDLTPLARVSEGDMIGVSEDDKTEIIANMDGMLILTPPSGIVRAGSTDPVGYIVEVCDDETVDVMSVAEDE